MVAEGTKVEAKYKGGSAWYKGVVTKEHADGSCDLLYDDGDTEPGVKPENIKSLEGGGGEAGAPSDHN